MDSQFSTLQILALPIIGALIGWITNYLAITMLFRPKKPLRIFGLKLQGLIPMRKTDLAKAIAETIEDTLLTVDDIKGSLLSPQSLDSLTALLRGKIDTVLDNILAKNSMLGMFLGQGDLRNTIVKILEEELTKLLPTLIDKAGEQLTSSLQIKQIIEDKITNFDLDTIETLIRRIANKELKAIEVLGGVLGFIVGAIEAVWLFF